MRRGTLVRAQRVETTDELPAPSGPARLQTVARDTVPPPYDEPILQQILETVQRVTEMALWAVPNHDALVSAEDIAQDTVTTLHQRGHPEAASLIAWAVGIAKFKLKEATRRSRTQVPQLPLSDHDHQVPSSDEQVLGIMHYVWLLDQIDPLDRMIVEWRQAGFSSREIAQELRGIGYPHMTANNVDQRFFRALKTLRTRIFAGEAKAT